jgi:hypothetical protein
MLYQIKNLRHRARGLRAEVMAALKLGVACELSAVHLKADGSRVDLGVLSRRLVTDAGAAFIVDAFQGITELEAMNYHASGTDTTAEAAGDTALGTEVASRVAGTQSEPAANQYRTVATIPYSSSLAITEHGVFSAAAAGTVLDRSVFAAINVVNGDGIQFTYTLTVNSGG